MLAAAATSVVLVAALATVGAFGGSVASADASGSITMDPSISLVPTGPEGSKDFILAGEDASFDLSVRNTSAVDGFNLAVALLVPVDVTFGSSDWGTPAIYGSGAELPNSAATGPLSHVPDHFQLWVFEDISDLPAGGERLGFLKVRPKAGTFPVGNSIEIGMTTYLSSNPNQLPVFDGSTSVSTDTDDTSQSADVSVTVPVKAIRVTKTEPSPESELLRGVHENATTYTITVENTGEGPVTDPVVVDYIPAGLEFLGCGGVDNTTGAAQLDGTEEYPSSGNIAGAVDPGSCVTPDRVETVENDSGAPAAAVYTKVTWNLANLTGGAQQNYAASAGNPGVTVIKYRAAVPLFENTMTFGGAGGAPTADSLDQTANLDNNNGPSTRQSKNRGPGNGDGISYTNTVVGEGTYGGATTTDSDTETIHAMDLRILKSVDKTTFETDGTATFTLTLDTSEYTSADNIVVTDVLPNGLCPANASGGCTSDIAELAVVGTGSAAGVTVHSIAENMPETGQYTITFNPVSVGPNASVTINLPAVMRADYDEFQKYDGNTSSGDTLTNYTEFTANSHSMSALDGVTSRGGGMGDEAFGDETDIWDDSDADIESNFSSISKKALNRAIVKTVGGENASDKCDVDPVSSDWRDTATPAFRLGDLVCYQLTVNFADGIHIRNPKVTDFLPRGVNYVDSAVYSFVDGGGANLNVPSNIASPTGADSTTRRLQWLPGAADGAGNRFVPPSSTLVIHLLGEVVELSANDGPQDKPENLMKYQQENVDGDLYFLRDQAEISIDYGVSLLKGVKSVEDHGGASDRGRDARNSGDGRYGSDDGGDFNSNRDGIQVVQGEKVAYRVDLTAPYAVSGLEVWDALPDGIGCADVTAPGGATCASESVVIDGGTVTRDVLKWTGVSVNTPTHTLEYTVTMPTGLLVKTEHGNIASVIKYDVSLNGGRTDRTYYPEGSLDPTDRSGDTQVPGAGTTDTSTVYLPEPTVAKELVKTELGVGADGADHALGDTANTNEVAVEGELVTWKYSVTIPGHTSVENGVLRDTTLTGFTVDPTTSQWTHADGTTYSSSDAGFTFAAATGTLTFPAQYTNSTTAPETFSVQLTGYYGDAGDNGTTLTNTAQFTSETYTDTADAEVTYREPNPTIAKTATPDKDLVGGQEVTYTLTATNPGSDVPTSWDTVVTDCVPGELENVTLTDNDGGNAAVGAASSCDIAPGTGNGTSITWAVGDLAGGATASIKYTATIPDEPSGSGGYMNTASITGYTLPTTQNDSGERGTRTGTDEQTVTIKAADLTKTASPGQATIGEAVTYTLAVDLPRNVNFYDAKVVDTLPADLTFSRINGVQCGAYSGTCPDGVSAGQSGQTLTWGIGDLPASAADWTLTLTYTAVVANSSGLASGDQLVNTAQFTWNVIDDDDDSGASTDSATATVTVIEPKLAIAKAVSNTDNGAWDAVDGKSTRAEIGHTVAYTVTVTNTGTSDAHNIVVVDTLPNHIGSIGSISDGGVYDDTVSPRTITWTVAGPYSPTDAPIEFTYRGTLSTTSATQTNTVAVTDFDSLPDGTNDSGRRHYEPTDVTDSAQVAPVLPLVNVAKDATNSTAYVGEPSAFTITITSDSDATAYNVSAVDTLPVNWSYDANSARVSVAAGAEVPAEPTAVGQVLTWTNLGDLTAENQTIVITYTATPNDPEAIPVAGHVAHQNTVSVTAEDKDGSTDADGTSYSGPDADETVYIDTADLAITKTAGANLIAGAPTPTIAWTITVTNIGPDSAAGPIRVTDSLSDVPDGFTVTDVSGTGWTCTKDVGGAANWNDGFTCEHSAALNNSAGTIITVWARADADFDLSKSPVQNTATVSSPTHDPDTDNNTDSGDVDVVARADLTVTKSGDTTVNAGGEINWTVTARNLGPSDSRSSTAKPITVTDEVPVGVHNVIVDATTLPTGWTASCSATPCDAGATVTFTLEDGGVLSPGDTAALALGGTIDSGYPASTPLVNTAEIHPGETTETGTTYEATNNTDSHTVTPTIDTTLGISKVRVVQVGGVWTPAANLDPVPDVVPGDPVSYLVTVSNNGLADARTVTVDDSVESYFSYVTVQNVVGSWARTSTATGYGDDQSFALAGDLVAGNSASFVVSFTLDPSYAGAAANAVQAHAGNSTNDPTDSTSTDYERLVDLGITKTHAASPVPVAGQDTVTYTLTATNHGPSDSAGPIDITDTLPAGFHYVPGSAQVTVAGSAVASGAEPAVNGRDLTWTLGDATDSNYLAIGQTIVITLDVTIDADVAVGSHNNVARVHGPHDDPNPSNDTATDPTPVRAEANVSVTKTADSATPVTAGTVTTFTVTVTNDGPSDAQNVVLTDTAPKGMTVSAITGPSGWVCSGRVCSVGSLAAGASATLTVTAKIGSGTPAGTLTNTASVTTVTDGDDPADNSDTADVQVLVDSNLSITKTASAASTAAGDTVTWTITVTADGPSDSVGPITVTDTLPAAESVRSASGTGWECTVGAKPTDLTGQQTVTCQRAATLTAGSVSPPITIEAAVDPAAPAGDHQNTAVIDDETATATTRVTRSAQLGITKTHQGRAAVGEDVIFTITVSNEGPSTATSVTITDPLPAGLSYQSAVGDGWDCLGNAQTLTCALGTALAPGTGTAPITVTTRVDESAVPLVVNTATGRAAEADDVQASDRVVVQPKTVDDVAALSIQKTIASYDEDQTAVYRITVRNTGGKATTDTVTITDDVPAGLSIVKVEGKRWTCDISGSLVVCDHPRAIEPGTSSSVFLTVTVDAAHGTVIRNEAEVSGGGDDVILVVDANADNDAEPGTDIAVLNVGDYIPGEATLPQDDETLASTGVPGWSLLIAALLLLSAGGALLVAARRKRAA